MTRLREEAVCVDTWTSFLGTLLTMLEREREKAELEKEGAGARLPK